MPRRVRRAHAWPPAAAALVAAAWVLAAPWSADLAAQQHRAWLGPGLWDNAWYGGHPTPAYSVLYPPLAALLGVRALGALSAVAAAALFAAFARGALGERRAAVGATWFGLGAGAWLFTGRVTFLLGVAVALGALLAAQRASTALAAGCAVLTTLASPVAGAFLALAGLAWALGGERRRGLVIAAAAVFPGLVLARLFGEGGTEPFAPSSFWPAVAGLAILAAVFARRGHRALAAGAALAALLCVAAFAVPNALGGNAARLGALAAGPVLACVLWPDRRAALAVAALPLAYWQLSAPVRDVATAAGDASTQAAYYAPLVAQLAARAGPPGRVEVPFTRVHAEAALLARHVAIARGWERQLDRRRNALFYGGGPLTAGRYLAWLRANAVRWVALPDVALDRSARAEAALVRAGVAGLRPVWRGAHWRLLAVSRPAPLASGAARATALRTASVTLRAARAGTATVRVHWSPYWALVEGSGCVRRAPGDWTGVDVRDPGVLRIAQRFSAVRGLAQAGGARCGS